MEQLRDQGLDLDVPRLWVIDGSKALTSAINSLCGQAAKMQRCQIHKISKVTERLPKDMREQVAWRMKAAFGLQWMFVDHQIGQLGGTPPQPAGDQLPERRHGAALDGDGLFLESERGMRRIKGYTQLPELIRVLRPQQEQRP